MLAGTVVQGALHVGEQLELPELRLQRRVKGMQAFRRPVPQCHRGDRVGICVAQLDPKLIERGLACAPGDSGYEVRRGAARRNFSCSGWELHAPGILVLGATASCLCCRCCLLLVPPHCCWRR